MASGRLTKLTPEILRGAVRCGWSSQVLAKLLRIKPERFDALVKGAQRLAPEQMSLIEKKTRPSVGELAALGMEANISDDRRNEDTELLGDTLKLMHLYAARRATSQPSAHLRTRARPSKIKVASQRS